MVKRHTNPAAPSVSELGPTWRFSVVLFAAAQLIKAWSYSAL